MSENQSATNFIVSLVIIDGRAIWSNEVEVLNDILSIIQIAAYYRALLHPLLMHSVMHNYYIASKAFQIQHKYLIPQYTACPKAHGMAT